ncbi:hypothetical protein PoB_001750700 [Plakobranchus ocellatus]|uniref:Uncharacterized protein n=1 Tax=Plakobranchus ocellatus TaxID=259542 RepID=A0AAV3Z947_9GAST|nr:hypothetical protein PoB_001750700 [Plakobranchus ocellatus]
MRPKLFEEKSNRNLYEQLWNERGKPCRSSTQCWWTWLLLIHVGQAAAGASNPHAGSKFCPEPASHPPLLPASYLVLAASRVWRTFTYLCVNDSFCPLSSRAFGVFLKKVIVLKTKVNNTNNFLTN